MQCSKCSADIPDAQDYCSQCFTAVERPSWWTRLWRSLFEDPSPRVQVSFTSCQRIEFVDPTTGQHRVVHSLDQVPPEIRAHFEELQRQALQGNCKGSFHVRDLSGIEHTYNSLDEMPPEVRNLFEEVRRLGPNAPGATTASTPPPGS